MRTQDNQGDRIAYSAEEGADQSISINQAKRSTLGKLSYAAPVLFSLTLPDIAVAQSCSDFVGEELPEFCEELAGGGENGGGGGEE